MVLDRLVGDAELAGDQFVAVASCHLVEDLDLAWRQLDEQWPEGFPICRRGDVQRRRRFGRRSGAKAGQDARGDGGKAHDFLVDGKFTSNSASQCGYEDVGIGTGAQVDVRSNASRFEQLDL